MSNEIEHEKGSQAQCRVNLGVVKVLERVNNNLIG